MVIVDNRDGSKELADYVCLRDNCAIGTLEFGDVMLTGNGPNDTTISVGVELKSVHDLLQSIGSGRLAGHQLPGMFQMYDHCWLLIYGHVRAGHDNYLEIYRGKRWQNYKLGRRAVPYSYLEGFLLTAQLLSPLRVKWVYSKEEAAVWVAVMDRWLGKKWDRHKALSVFNTAGTIAAPPGADPVEAQMARLAASLPGVGWTRGWAAAKYFTSIRQMMDAPGAEWEKVPGFGPVLSKSVRNTIRRTK